MTKQFKLKAIFTLLLTAIILFCCGMFTGLKAHATEVSITAETFYMQNGASVRIVENSSGIRFKANITKGAYDGILSTYPAADGYTYRVYTKVSPENNSTATPRIIEHPKGFVFDDGASSDAVATVNAAIVYDNLDENLKVEAYKTVLTAQTFIDVEKDDVVVETYEANVPAGSARSMRSVANVDKILGNTEELLNAYIGSYAVEESGAKINTFTDKGTVTLPLGVTPESVHIGAEKVEFSVDDENSLINFECNKDYDATKYVAIFDANGNVYNYKAEVESCAYINESNYKDETYGLFAAIDANVDIVLESDLDMTEMARTTTGTYDKTFDGNGKTLNNFSSVTNGNGGLFYTFGGTLKNVVIKCVELGSTNIATGIIAYQNNYLDVTIEDVYIEVGTVAIGNVGQAGLFVRTQQNTNYGKITATNLVINFVGTISKGTTNYFGYLCGFGTASASGNGQFELKNCYFYNGGEYDISLFVYREGWSTSVTTDSTYTVYNNGNTSMNAYKVKKNAGFTSAFMNDALTSSMTEGFTVTEINQNNVNDETNGLYASIKESKNILLTSDLDMTDVDTSAISGMSKYTGVFDGDEHKIYNVTFKDWLSGTLFYQFAGSCHNVAIILSKLGYHSGSNGVNSYTFGGVAYMWQGSGVMSNIFVDISKVQVYYAGGIVGYARSGVNVNDILVIMPALDDSENMILKDTSKGVPGACAGHVFAGTTITIKNSYFVGCGGNVVGTRIDGTTNYATEVNQKIDSTSTYKTYDALSNLNADTTKTLTSFLTKCLAAKNG